MVLTVHHLGISQSERILFLCEELAIDYKIIHHTRDPIGAPESLKSVPGNSTGKAPFIEDPEAGITMSESAAICDYLLAKNAAGELGSQNLEKNLEKNLAKSYGEPGYIDFVYWYHFSNGTLQAMLTRFTFFEIGQIPEDNAAQKFSMLGLHETLRVMDERLKNSKWLAGEDFTVADIMSVYSLTSKRYFGPLVSYKDYPNIVRYLKDIGDRPAYQKAMEKGDPQMKLLLGAEPPGKTLIQAGGVESDFWRKESHI
ncbi:putative glutathione S-transferase [Didymella exigua CBS 183.55]|uniref:Putative glutathione S-transferase n=1 Tax=Didymella exigua CBS 183.55 TaxID=1150837 RepID=A0A6A5RPU4_9PLEO|nr:putative glutathione S-transferase [Didymella exigua CBS 183.55]KAF1929074.1 putative glutathione S-transferase [Didymella exigua CBS 183.55]